MGRLAGKVAVVAGVGPGIGRSAALTFAREGAAVVLVSRTPERLDAVAAEIEAGGGSALAVPADLTDEAQVESMTRASVDAFGRIDVLLNNGSFTGGVSPFVESDADLWRRVMDGALVGAVNAARSVARVMIEQGDGGSIINTSSLASKERFEGRAHYAAAKAALNNLSHTLSWELGSHGIRVNAIVVGGVETDPPVVGAVERAAKLGVTVDDLNEAWRARSPLRRMVTPQDVANLALFLASDESAAMTGQAINLTAGVVQH